MTRYQSGYNPLTGQLYLPDDGDGPLSMAKVRLVSGTASGTSTQPFPRQFELWTASLKVAVARDLDPVDDYKDHGRKFHDNIGDLLAARRDLTIIALIEALAVNHRVRRHGEIIDDAIAVLRDPLEQVAIANRYACAGYQPLLDMISTADQTALHTLMLNYLQLSKDVQRRVNELYA